MNCNRPGSSTGSPLILTQSKFDFDPLAIISIQVYLGLDSTLNPKF